LGQKKICLYGAQKSLCAIKGKRFFLAKICALKGPKTGYFTLKFAHLAHQFFKKSAKKRGVLWAFFPLRRTNFWLYGAPIFFKICLYGARIFYKKKKNLALRRTKFSLYGAPIFGFTAHKNSCAVKAKI
jgi:hypothetical protein